MSLCTVWRRYRASCVPLPDAHPAIQSKVGTIQGTCEGVGVFALATVMEGVPPLVRVDAALEAWFRATSTLHMVIRDASNQGGGALLAGQLTAIMTSFTFLLHRIVEAERRRRDVPAALPRAHMELQALVSAAILAQSEFDHSAIQSASVLRGAQFRSGSAVAASAPLHPMNVSLNHVGAATPRPSTSVSRLRSERSRSPRLRAAISVLQGGTASQPGSEIGTDSQPSSETD